MSEKWMYCNGEGGLEGRSKSVSRRALMTAGAAGLAWWMTQRTAWAQATFQTEPTHDNVLVVIFLRGGADGLNIVVPHGEDDYYKARPTLGIAQPGTGRGENDKVRDLDGFFGLNPAMAGLHQLYQEGEAAFVHAVGSGDQTRSHFEAMSVMERGIERAGGSASGGWLARHLLATPGQNRPMRAVALSSTTPDSLGGALGALTVQSISNYKLEIEDDGIRGLLKDLYAQGSDAVSQAGQDTFRVLDMLQKSDPATYKPEHNAAYPDTGLGRTLREVAYLIKNDFGLEVAALDMGADLGGWDTHIAQGTTSGWLSTLVGDLSQSISAFRKDMGGEMRRVTVVVQTEFGRRVAENSGFGTDHGRGSMMMLVGGGIHGGKVYADWPGLAPDKREGPGDLPVTTDYRDVLAELLQKRLATPDVSKVFPGFRHQPLGIFV